MAGTVPHFNSNSKPCVPDNVASVGCMCWERQGEWKEVVLYFWCFDLEKTSGYIIKRMGIYLQLIILLNANLI